MAELNHQDYQENLGIRNWLLWLVLICLLLFFTFSTLSQVLFKIPIGDNPMPNWALITGTLFIALIVVLMAQTRLLVRMDSKEVQVSFGSLGQESFSWKEVKTLKFKRLPLTSIGKKQRGPKEIIFNPGAQWALFVELKSGRKLWIATRNKEGLQSFLKGIKKLKA